MKITTAVVGMKAGEREHVVDTVSLGDPVLLVPEPDNDYDPNAVRVFTIPKDAARDSTWEGGWIIGPQDRTWMMDRQAGYVPADVAARLDLPPDGVTGEVVHVRYFDNAPKGFDVQFDAPRLAPR